MVGEFSIFHWLVVFVIVLLVFGPKRLPELAKALGTGIRDFKKALNTDDTKPGAAPTATTSTTTLPPAVSPQVPTVTVAKEVEAETKGRA